MGLLCQFNAKSFLKILNPSDRLTYSCLVFAPFQNFVHGPTYILADLECLCVLVFPLYQ